LLYRYKNVGYTKYQFQGKVLIHHGP
jgi:hypothetical protein